MKLRFLAGFVTSALSLLPMPAGAQWLHDKTPGIPRTADGKPDLAAPAPKAADGKPDFSGVWAIDNTGAAETGSVLAQVQLASFYDPLVTPPKAGFTPDGARAADWYERAALAGNAEAQRKVGLLLAKGGAGLTADQGRAKSWLQQAAAQNDAEAKKALETMPK